MAVERSARRILEHLNFSGRVTMLPFQASLGVVQEGLHGGQKIQDVAVDFDHHVHNPVPAEIVVGCVFLAELVQSGEVISEVEFGNMKKLLSRSVFSQELGSGLVSLVLLSRQFPL